MYLSKNQSECVFYSKFSDFPPFLPFFPEFPIARFCAYVGGRLKKNGISCIKDNNLCVNYIILALI